MARSYEIESNLRMLKNQREKIMNRIVEHSPIFMHQGLGLHEEFLIRIFNIYDNYILDLVEDDVTALPKDPTPSSKYGGNS